jgi:hypothetical protein
MATKQRKTERRTRSFQVGDRVRILNHLNEIAWGDRKPQQFAYIMSIDGAYIRVRPLWWKATECIERYPNEIAHAPIGKPSK